MNPERYQILYILPFMNEPNRPMLFRGQIKINERTTPSINDYTRARADLRHKYTAACIEIFGTSDQ